MKQAKGKVAEARNALNEVKNKVDTVKSATEQFKAAAQAASQAAAALYEKVKEAANIEKNKITEVASLANKAVSTTKTSHESVALLCKKVKEAGEATTRAGNLVADAQGMSRSAAADADEVVSKEAELAQKAFEKLLVVLRGLSGAQKCSEETKEDATTEAYAFNAMNSAKEAFGFFKEETPKAPLIVTEGLQNAAKKAADLAKDAAGDAAAASSTAKEASGHAENTVKSAEAWLGQIEDSLKPLKKQEKGPESSPPEPSQDESHSQSLTQDPLASSSTGGKPSDQQKADTTATDTEKSSSVPSEVNRDTNSIKSNVHNTLSDVRRTDSSVSPPWVRTPLLLVVGVLGLLAVC
ncbi:hypothetical protein DQ04_12661000 [Trypanosoma grayi]|uniref:hypothetical protein n=1 Tax=Trypanosoma grayi TaxID=71804 RepID=UPI0004F438E3|nr:hypothetical protein DQ04_12661000 [Trypanosoma grayi]KEG06705.1 hypothetical protein DQ04_12661000 [Trypanosoma grayi]